MEDRAGELTRRSLLGGAMGLGMTGSLPLLFVPVGSVPRYRARLRTEVGRAGGLLAAIPVEFPDPTAADLTDTGPIFGDTEPDGPDQDGSGTGTPSTTGAHQPGTGSEQQSGTGPLRQPGSSTVSQMSLGTPPLIHGREEWGARRPREGATLLPKGPDHIVIHNTQTPNVTDLSLDHAYVLSRKIQYFHMYDRGWDDIGQQLTISRGGYVMEGRNRSLTAILAGRNVMSSQTMSQNDHTIGIENEGTYRVDPVPPQLWASLVQVCAWLCRQYELNPYRAIVGHRDYVMTTDCPGNVLYAMLPELRRTVAQGLRRSHLQGRPPAPVNPETPPAPLGPLQLGWLDLGWPLSR